MNTSDIPTWVSALAAAISALYTARQFHRNHDAQELVNQPCRPRIVLVLLACVAWAATFVDLAGRHWLSRPNVAVEEPLSPTDARIEVTSRDEGFSPLFSNKLAVNSHIINSGQAVAQGPSVRGILFPESGPVPATRLDAAFYVLKEAALLTPVTQNEMQIGERLLFTVPNQPYLADITKETVEANSQIYLLVVMAYRDKDLAPDRYIFTESCAYLFSQRWHVCESGHNRIYSTVVAAHP